MLSGCQRFRYGISLIECRITSNFEALSGVRVWFYFCDTQIVLKLSYFNYCDLAPEAACSIRLNSLVYQGLSGSQYGVF